jgi:ACS family tartrate transporter-like MFS transporter
VASQASGPLVSILALGAAAMGVFAALPTFWTLPTALLSGRAAAGGIALVNAVGGLGGFVGPSLMGWIKDATGRFDHALAAVGLLLIAVGLLAARLGRDIARRGAAA